MFGQFCLSRFGNLPLQSFLIVALRLSTVLPTFLTMNVITELNAVFAMIMVSINGHICWISQYDIFFFRTYERSERHQMGSAREFSGLLLRWYDAENLEHEAGHLRPWFIRPFQGNLHHQMVTHGTRNQGRFALRCILASVRLYIKGCIRWSISFESWLKKEDRHTPFDVFTVFTKFFA